MNIRAISIPYPRGTSGNSIGALLHNYLFSDGTYSKCLKQGLGRHYAQDRDHFHYPRAVSRVRICSYVHRGVLSWGRVQPISALHRRSPPCRGNQRGSAVAFCVGNFARAGAERPRLTRLPTGRHSADEREWVGRQLPCNRDFA